QGLGVPGIALQDGTEGPHRLVALLAAQQQRRQVQAQRHVVRDRRHCVPQALKQRVRFHGPVPGSWLPHFHSMGSGDPVGTVFAIASRRQEQALSAWVESALSALTTAGGTEPEATSARRGGGSVSRAPRGGVAV